MVGPSLPGICRRNNKPLLVVCWVCGMAGKADPKPTHAMICTQLCRHRWDCTAALWRDSVTHSGLIWSSELDSPTLPCTTAPSAENWWDDPYNWHVAIDNRKLYR